MQYSVDGMSVGFQRRFGRFGDGKHRLSVSGIEPLFLFCAASKQITVPTELFRLSSSLAS